MFVHTQVQIEILDKREVRAANGTLVRRSGPYNVSIVLKVCRSPYTVHNLSIQFKIILILDAYPTQRPLQCFDSSEGMSDTIYEIFHT